MAPFVKGAACVHRIPPRVRDDRDTPLEWDETTGNTAVIWVFGEAEYFLKRDWTGGIALNRFEKSGFPRNPCEGVRALAPTARNLSVW